ncbi:uncharacterized protein BJ171DRAFT_499158 [Polychytrium aggregatum]|uniref:uncharacterized protein n=1 Tax=Polychytrium aggregatum TaxID=110093 RepID=UPI0022FEFB18|nr:uncharacterized protein BJ171DRAFT_499158 [Polychytrium aggregatum]KAI9206229.1 hypothetical protein BJ171DRAFT_499158 [Polychytrium aggregatum]
MSLGWQNWKPYDELRHWRPWIQFYDSWLEQYPTIKDLAAKTKISKVSLSVFMKLLLVLTALTPLSGYTTTAIGLLYPCFRTLEAIRLGDVEEMRLCCMYFVFFEALRLLECLGINSMFKLWRWFKVVALMWAFLPQTKGARTLLNWVMPYFISWTEVKSPPK